MNADGEPLGATADVAPVNFWLHALFSQIVRNWGPRPNNLSGMSASYNFLLKHPQPVGSFFYFSQCLNSHVNQICNV